MRTWIFALFAFSPIAFADGVPVDPSTPSGPPPVPPSVERTSVTPPDCVKNMLSAIHDKEAAYFATKKAYSDSLLEVHALSVVAASCSGWSLPTLAITYGGSGFTAATEDTAKGIKWTINQDKALILDQREIKPIDAPVPGKK